MTPSPICRLRAEAEKAPTEPISAVAAHGRRIALGAAKTLIAHHFDLNSSERSEGMAQINRRGGHGTSRRSTEMTFVAIAVPTASAKPTTRRTSILATPHCASIRL